MIHVRCPNCQRKLRVNESMSAARCPTCGTAFKTAAAVISAEEASRTETASAPDPAKRQAPSKIPPPPPKKPVRAQDEDGFEEVVPIDDMEEATTVRDERKPSPDGHQYDVDE